jgi:hypothetical protein
MLLSRRPSPVHAPFHAAFAGFEITRACLWSLLLCLRHWYSFALKSPLSTGTRLQYMQSGATFCLAVASCTQSPFARIACPHCSPITIGLRPLPLRSKVRGSQAAARSSSDRCPYLAYLDRGFIALSLQDSRCRGRQGPVAGGLMPPADALTPPSPAAGSIGRSCSPVIGAAVLLTVVARRAAPVATRSCAAPLPPSTRPPLRPQAQQQHPAPHSSTSSHELLPRHRVPPVARPVAWRRGARNRQCGDRDPPRLQGAGL